MSSDGPGNPQFSCGTRHLEWVAVVLAILVAVAHMFHPDRGVERFTLLLATDPGLFVVQPRTVAFVASSFLLLVGASALALGVASRGLFAAGIGLMATYILGYIGWHLTGHGAFLPGREAIPHSHGDPVIAVIAHFAGDPLAGGTLLAELLLLLVSMTLYLRRSG